MNDLLIYGTEAARNAERLARWIAKDGPEQARREREFRRDYLTPAHIARNAELYTLKLRRVMGRVKKQRVGQSAR